MNWLDELDLDPESPWLRMGTRALGDRPWLVVDDKRDAELEMRRKLLADRPSEVLAEPENASAAAAELESLIAEAGVEIADGPSPLSRLGASVQEDLCLLEPVDGRWVLRAAVLCFPSRWRLASKLDKPLGAVHGPVLGYADSLQSRVDKLISGLGERTVLRRNWFIHPDPALFQPDRPLTEPIVPNERSFLDLHVRSERQTLRLLPNTRWCVFTIRIQHCPLGVLVDSRGTDLDRWLGQASEESAEHRGLSPIQVRQLQRALG